MDLGKIWQRDGKWGKSDRVKFSARSLQWCQIKEPKPQFFYYFFVMNIPHQFGHFRFADFYET